MRSWLVWSQAELFFQNVVLPPRDAWWFVFFDWLLLLRKVSHPPIRFKGLIPGLESSRSPPVNKQCPSTFQMDGQVRQAKFVSIAICRCRPWSMLHAVAGGTYP